MAVIPAFTEADIKGAAGDRSFARGREYLDSVEDLEIGGSEITASVYGNSEYRVSLAAGDDGLTGDCTCPYGREGFFCKHCVAVGLAVLRIGDDLPRHVEVTRSGRQLLESWLESLSKEDLLAELSALLHEDRALRRRFELRAASANADGVIIRRAVRDLIMLPRRGYIEYGEAPDYANDVRNAAAAIGDLIDAGGAADAIGIAREAIGLATDAFAHVDDSSGFVGQAAYELLDVHLRACEAAPPEPASLGNYVADLLLGNDYGLAPDLGDYAGLLGDKGSAVIRKRAAAAYAKDPKDWRARSLMETIARDDGDVDAVVAIYAADLTSHGWTHLLIARELDAAGRDREALDWAERGLREAEQPDSRLVDYLAGRYAAAGRKGDALSLRRDRFRAERTLVNYQALRAAAAECGTWAVERESALALLRDDAHRLRFRVPWAWGGGPVLVDALLGDGDLDAAWVAAGDTEATTGDQWVALADASADTRPADASAAYLRVVDSMKQLTGNDTYQRMATLLLAARACHETLGTAAEFRRYVAFLRQDQKRKRNLMKILDQKGL
ncbi:MAG TPA: SWIM zinc finger family protein [Streptosporangiaceae bacterium]|nr:SWIM zinc finger family protein [Streptosporangiaceae bacterium]